MTAGREFTFTYNGQAIPGTVGGVSVTIDAVHRVRKTSRNFEVSFDILVYNASTGAAFASCISSLESTFREPLATLTLASSTIGASDTGTLITIGTSANTGFGIEASIEKIGGGADSGRSRLYRVTISGGLPWTLTSPASGFQGLREFNYTVEYSAARRMTLILDGEYTAQVGGSKARAQYLANISDLYTSAKSLIGGTWPTVAQPVEESHTPDREDHVCKFRRVYKELILSEAGSTDDADILDQTLVIEVEAPGKDDAPGETVVKPQSYRAVYTAAIDHTRTKNLKSKWESTIRPWIVQQVRNQARVARLTLIRESFRPQLEANTLEGSLEFEGVAPSGLRSITVVEEVDVQHGSIISKTWPQQAITKDIQPTEAFVFVGPKTVKKTITTTLKTGGPRPAALFRPQSQLGRKYPGGRPKQQDGVLVVPESTRSVVDPRMRGAQGIGDIDELYEQSIIEVVELVVTASGGSSIVGPSGGISGGGSGGGTTSGTVSN